MKDYGKKSYYSREYYQQEDIINTQSVLFLFLLNEKRPCYQAYFKITYAQILLHHTLVALSLFESMGVDLGGMGLYPPTFHTGEDDKFFHTPHFFIKKFQI